MTVDKKQQVVSDSQILISIAILSLIILASEIISERISEAAVVCVLRRCCCANYVGYSRGRLHAPM